MQELCPAEIFERQTSVPDLRHVRDLLTIELHDVHVIRAGLSASGRYGPTLAGMRPVKNPVDRHIVPRAVQRKRFHFVARVRQDADYALHPVCVLRESSCLQQRLSLCRECRIRRTIRSAHFPSLARLACVKKALRCIHDRCGFRRHNALSSLSE